MKTTTTITTRRGFIDPVTISILGLGALGVLQWNDTKTNKAQDAAIHSNRQSISQVQGDVDYLGNYVADKPWLAHPTPTPQPTTKDGWRNRLTPIGTVIQVKE